MVANLLLNLFNGQRPIVKQLKQLKTSTKINIYSSQNNIMIVTIAKKRHLTHSGPKAWAHSHVFKAVGQGHTEGGATIEKTLHLVSTSLLGGTQAYPNCWTELNG